MTISLNYFGVLYFGDFKLQYTKTTELLVVKILTQERQQDTNPPYGAALSSAGGGSHCHMIYIFRKIFSHLASASLVVFNH